MRFRCTLSNPMKSWRVNFHRSGEKAPGALFGLAWRPADVNRQHEDSLTHARLCCRNRTWLTSYTEWIARLRPLFARVISFLLFKHRFSLFLYYNLPVLRPENPIDGPSATVSLFSSQRNTNDLFALSFFFSIFFSTSTARNYRWNTSFIDLMGNILTGSL